MVGILSGRGGLAGVVKVCHFASESLQNLGRNSERRAKAHCGMCLVNSPTNPEGRKI
jgi:hypothetical protein